MTVDDGVPIACAEPLLVCHVLENLLSNAAKYSPTGTEVQVTVTTGPRGEPMVLVADQGIGFSDDEAALLFTPFFRSQAAAVRAGGMGLGLAVCRRIVEAQGGSISARVRPEGGAEFAFTLPPA
jgi:two-component system sensor histidine kinase KdpD